MLPQKIRLLAIFMALVVFISTGGVVLAIHYCYKENSKDVSLIEEDSCCSEEKGCGTEDADKTGEADCCDLFVSYHKLTILTTLLEGHDFDLIPVSSVEYFKFDQVIPADLPVISLISKPPPFFTGGKTFLHFSQQFLI